MAVTLVRSPTNVKTLIPLKLTWFFDHFGSFSFPEEGPSLPLFWSLIWKMNTNVLRESRSTLLPRSPEKSNNSFSRDTRYSATHTSFSLLRPQSFHPALHSLCCGNFLLHFISLFRMCTLGSDSQLGLCHCWGVCVWGGFHRVWGISEAGWIILQPPTPLPTRPTDNGD